MRRPRITSLLILLTLAAIGISMPTSFARATPGSTDDQLLAQLGRQSGSPLQTARHTETGKLRFLALDAEHPLPRAANLRANATPEQASRQFLTTYGSLFGLHDQAQELTLMRNETLAGNAFTRFQQSYKGIPILAGELVVQSDKNRNIVSTNGEVLPDLNLSVQPRINSAAAARIAQTLVAKSYKLPHARFSASAPQLWIFNPALLGGPGLRRSTLVWRTEVRASSSATPIRELVLVDAQNGAIALHFNQIADAKVRVVCNDNNVVDADGDPDNNCTPDKYVRTEGGPPVNDPTDTDANLAYDYAGVTYDFYHDTFGRDSLDGKGLPLVSLVKYCSPDDACPYGNAFWDGRQMVYGDGYASADDVVGHELSHGFTEFTSHLFYYYQSGAINESLSDVFGELIDLSDGVGTDTPAVRWEVGEDLPPATGAIRDMKNPPHFDNPDSTSSSLYNSDIDDSGGVHINSGVNNKAAYLLTDGDTFNGVTVSGIGITKTAAIYYTVEVAFLTSGSDYQDLYSDLQAACASLAATGAYGITAVDCVQVKHAVDATEMNITPELAPVPEAAVCSGQTSNDLFYDDLENPQSGNWISAATSGAINEWYYPANSNPYSLDVQYATSGVGNFWGNDYGPSSDDLGDDPAPPVGDYSIAMTHDVAVPANAFFHFRHAFEFENSFGDDYDGGVVEYSTNGGTSWKDAGPLFSASGGANGYNVELADSNNPLAGRQAFGNVSQGYYSSRADLSSLAGQNVRFRFRIGTDEAVGYYGWFIDDVRVYTCTNTPPTSALKLANQTFTETSGAATVEVALSGVTSQDVVIPFTVTGTATLNEDYTLPTNVFIVPAGQASGKIVIPIIADTIDDPDETITVTLGTPVSALLGSITTETIIISDGSKYKLFLPVVAK